MGEGAGTRACGARLCRGSLRAEALHNPTPLHAVEKEEVVVRWVPLRQGLGEKQGEL